MNVDAHYLKVEEVAEMLAMDPSTIYKKCKEGEIPSIRIGAKTVRIPKAGLEAYLSGSKPGLLAEVSAGDPTESVQHQVFLFTERTGETPRDFIERWRSGDVVDTPENADLAIEALSLRRALDRAEAPSAEAIFA